jgi:hypothetical protein
VTGSADSIECTLRKFGVLDTEFSSPAVGGNGRIQLYSGSGAGGAVISAATNVSETALWGDQSKLNSYDLAILGCQGSAYARTNAELTALGNYANAGGRVLATHYAYSYLQNNTAFQGIVNWSPDQAVPADQTGYINMSPDFPRGQQLAQWLKTVGASSTLGQVPLNTLRKDLASVTSTAQTWTTINSPQSIMQLTFNTPVSAPPEQQCGRVQFNEYHISNATVSPGAIFPSECLSGPMTPQETMLAFSLFDLSSTTITPAQPSTIALSSAHTPATFTQGGAPGTVTINVQNPSATIVLDQRLTLTAAIPHGLTLVGMAGTSPSTGWTCSTATARCTRTTPLAASASDNVALTLSVDANAPIGGPLTLTATAESGGLAALVTQSESIAIRVVPTLQWSTPAAITWPAALGAAQLNASAGYNGNAVAGSFTYTPAASAVLDAGSYTLLADFTPADTTTYTTASKTTTLTVLPYTTATTLSANPTATVFGQSTTLSADVTVPAGATGGSVRFDDGGTPIPGCDAQPLAGGQAQCQTAALAAATHTLSARFSSSDANTTSSTSVPASLTVAKASTAVALAAPAPITFGETAIVGASVSVVAPGGEPSAAASRSTTAVA